MTAAPDRLSDKLNSAARRFQTIFRTPALFRTALVAKLPLFLFTGATVSALDLNRCSVELPFGWINKNPFGSMYFASIMMCAEATTGGLVMLHDENRTEDFSTIVKSISGNFHSAAYSDMTFECDQGDLVGDMLDRAAEADGRVEQNFEVHGHDEDGGHCATVEVIWSVRTR